MPCDFIRVHSISLQRLNSRFQIWNSLLRREISLRAERFSAARNDSWIFSFRSAPRRDIFSFHIPYLSADVLIHNMSVVVATERIEEVLEDHRLLPRAHFLELTNKLFSCCDDWGILCHECVYRGWLTPFQARRLLQGRGRELIVGSYVLLEPLAKAAWAKSSSVATGSSGTMPQ